MAFLTVNTNTPQDARQPLISFRVKGTEVAALYQDGGLKVTNVQYPDKTSSSSGNGSGSSGVDGGQF